MVFLASSREHFITGISLSVDGGLDAGQWLLSLEPEVAPVFLIQSPFHVGDNLLYVVRLSSCQVVLLDISAFHLLSLITSIRHVDRTSFLHLYGLSHFLGASPDG